MKKFISYLIILLITILGCNLAQQENLKINLNYFEDFSNIKVSSYDYIHNNGSMYFFSNDTLFEIDLNIQKLKKTYCKFDAERLKSELNEQFIKDSLQGLFNDLDYIWELDNYEIYSLKAGTDNKITGLIKIELNSTVKGSPVETYYLGVAILSNQKIDFILYHKLINDINESFQSKVNNFNIYDNHIIYFTTKNLGSDSVKASIKHLDLKSKSIKELSNFQYNKYYSKDLKTRYLAQIESIQNEYKIFYTNNEQIWSIDKETKKEELILNLEPYFKDSLIKINNFAIEKNNIYLQISGCHKDSSYQKFKTNKLIYQYDIQTKELNISKKLDEYGVIKLVRDNKLYIIKENEEKIWVDIL